jgi:hypothetical protein
MKKFNMKKAVTLTALLGMAVLTQACGKSSDSASNVVSGSVAPLFPGVVNPVNTTIYGACQNIQAAQQSGGVTINSAIATTASDGVQVCKVSMIEGGQYQGSRAFLGPNATQSSPLPTGIFISDYDQLQVSVSGTYTTASFSFGCGSNSVSPLMYAYVPGLNVFQVGTMQGEVPVNGGGILEIGLNQSYGGGQMCIQLQATITRCIDSAGSTHPC